jgi:hypothetical protein
METTENHADEISALREQLEASRADARMMMGLWHSARSVREIDNVIESANLDPIVKNEIIRWSVRTYNLKPDDVAQMIRRVVG